jgi:hypothetical protein
MLVELCVNNYATYDSLVNGADDIKKDQQHIRKKPLYG